MRNIQILANNKRFNMSKDDVSQIINSDENLVRNFISSITNAVNKKVEDRESKRHRNFSLILAAIALTGTAGIYSIITTTIDTAVSEAISKERASVSSIIAKEVEREISEVNDQLKLDKLFQQITYLAFSLDFKNSFSNSERDLVVNYLRQYKKGNGEVDEEFFTYLEKIVDSFSSAYLDSHIDEIYELYGDRMLEHPGISITLIDHYGRRYLAALHDGKKEEIDLLSPIASKVKKSAIRNNSPELAIALEFGESVFTQNTPGIDHVENLFTQAKLISDGEKSILISRLFRYRKSEYWQKRKRYIGVVIGRVYDEFFAENEKQIVELIVSDEVFRKLAARAVEYSDPLQTDLLKWARDNK